MSTKQEPKDPVVRAEEQLNRARLALAETTRETSDRMSEADALRERIGERPDQREAQAWAAAVIVHEARIAYLGKRRPALEAAVREAEVGLKEALAARAQAEITQQDETLDALNGQINAGLAAMLQAVEEHERIVAARDELAHQHDLPTPGRRRFLFAPATLRSKECAVLRDRLDLRYALGGIREHAAAVGGPVGMIPSA